MISSLSISNYALMKKLELAPDAGLNIITGETGAGKSIMLGAVGLLLGKRADVKVLLDKERKCIVEGEFDISKLKLQKFFNEEDLEYDDHSIIRREISPKGKSRAFINDVPVTLDVMKAVGLKLIDIHSQNESIQLGNKTVKVKLMDDYAQSSASLDKYQISFNEYNRLVKKLEELIESEKSSKKDEDFNKYQLDELATAQLKDGEQTELEKELNLLENAEDIKLKLSNISTTFEQSEPSLNDKLRESANVLKNMSSFSKELNDLSERFFSAIEEISDVVRDLTAIHESVEDNPSRMEEVGQKLDLIYKLQQKHKAGSIKELLDIQQRLETEAVGATNLSEEIAVVKKQLEQSEKDLAVAAEVLSDKRRTHIDNFSSAMNVLLKEVGMPDGHVEIAYKRVEPWVMGVDEIEILFSANKGIRPEPVGNIASGGEFSRLMFCVKYLLADKKAMPTVIFDEIDTGVSGEIAMKMANMMKKMSANHQIIAISHLPQIAARGGSHYFVYKNNDSEKTESMIRKLDVVDRLTEIAKMIGGEDPSETAVNSARELIEMK